MLTAPAEMAVEIQTALGSDITVTVNNPSLTPNPAKVGDTVTFKGEIVASAPIPDTGRANVTFGDGTSGQSFTAAADSD